MCSTVSPKVTPSPSGAPTSLTMSQVERRGDSLPYFRIPPQLHNPNSEQIMIKNITTKFDDDNSRIQLSSRTSAYAPSEKCNGSVTKYHHYAKIVCERCNGFLGGCIVSTKKRLTIFITTKKNM